MGGVVWDIPPPSRERRETDLSNTCLKENTPWSEPPPATITCVRYRRRKMFGIDNRVLLCIPISIETGMQGVCNTDYMQNTFRLPYGSASAEEAGETEAFYLHLSLSLYIYIYIHICIRIGHLLYVLVACSPEDPWQILTNDPFRTPFGLLRPVVNGFSGE